MKIIIIFIISVIMLIATIIVTYVSDDKIKNEKKTCKKTKIKSLGYIPLNSKNKNLLIENNPKANIMSYIKDIRKNIIDSGDNVILITSCNQGEGKSWFANNIAVSLARINKKVLLIDSNLRKASNKSEIFFTENGEGLSNFIRNFEIEDKLGNLYKCKKYIRQTQIPNLYILSSGTITSNSAELIKSKKMNELIKLLKEMYDYIILDGTTFFENLDCVNLASIVDATVVVVENNKTKYKDLVELKQEVEINNAKLLGFVINKTDAKRGKYYAKNDKNNLGIYIETTKEEESTNEKSLDEIIEPMVDKIQENNSTKFNLLHNEIKDEILIEDFINDIEVNFNMRLNSIENNYKNFEEFSGYILKEIENIKNEVNDIKLQREKEKSDMLEQVLSTVENKKYDEQIELINEKITKLEEKRVEQNKKNNIINIGRAFIENRKYQEKVFSINESINYEDLEELAIEVIEFDEVENLYYTN